MRGDPREACCASCYSFLFYKAMILNDLKSCRTSKHWKYIRKLLVHRLDWRLQHRHSVVLRHSKNILSFLLLAANQNNRAAKAGRARRRNTGKKKTQSHVNIVVVCKTHWVYPYNLTEVDWIGILCLIKCTMF